MHEVVAIALAGFIALSRTNNPKLSVGNNTSRAIHSNPLERTEKEWQEQQTTSDYFDKKKLADSVAIRKKLAKEEGFQEVDFCADDGVKLKGLLRKKPNARYTLVSFCGFWPGKKEAMATLVELFPRDVNMLFVDARGHGQSSGRFISAGGDYGLDEPGDVSGAIKYVSRETDNTPIIMHGLCIGGRHTTLALAQLSSTVDQKTGQPLIAKHNVRGFICDSAPTGASPLKPVLAAEVTQKMLPQWIKAVPGYNVPKKDVQTTLLYRASAGIINRCIGVVRYFWFDSAGIDYNEATGALLTQGKADRITCPVLFIHAECDDYVSCGATRAVAQEVADKDEWYVPNESEHVVNHTKYPAEYTKRCAAFIDRALKKPLPQQPTPPLPYQKTSRDVSRQSLEVLRTATVLDPTE